MGKQKPVDDNTLDKQKNKTHKTLREKLRKKREQQKRHLKQKKQTKKNFDPIKQKEQFFMKNFQNKKELTEQFKYKKVKKYIEKFINVYQDDLEDFFELFKTFDQGGFIDIHDLQNKKLQKILKKMFKYLPLKRTKNQFRRKQNTGAITSLEQIVRNLVSESIQNYLEFGTDNQIQEEISSQDQNNQKDKNVQQKAKKKKVKKENIQELNQQKLIINQVKQNASVYSMGPSIPQEEREKIAKMFQQQLKAIQEENVKQKEAQENQFDAIFGNASMSKRHAPKKTIDSIPQHLLAEGSAKLGQKVDVNQDQLDEYDSIYRPKKLIEEHRQMLNIGQTNSEGKKQRVPFDRERDIVNGRGRIMQNGVLKNGVFFDFKDRMSKPKGTNNFL